MLSLIGSIKSTILLKKEKDLKCYVGQLHSVLCIYPESVRFFFHACDISH